MAGVTVRIRIRIRGRAVARRVAPLLAAMLLVAACTDNSAEPSSTDVAAATEATTTTPTSVSATTVTTITMSTPATTTAGEYDFTAVAAIAEQFVVDQGLNGAGLVIVDRDDGIISEMYFGEFSADRISLVASASKMLTAGVLLRLQDRGLLDLDTPIGQLVPWAGDHPDLTVAQMLSNSSGLVGLLPNPGYPPYSCQFIGNDMVQCAQEVLATDADDADVVPPDTEYRYGGVQWQVAGAIAEAVSGKSWAELVDETYRQPCDVQSLGYNNHWVPLASGFDYPESFDLSQLAPTDNPHMEGGAYIDPVDYATLLLMHLRAGECEGGQVLSPEAVEQSHSDRIGDVWGGSVGEGTGYGLGWWVDRNSGRIFDPGAYGAVPWLDVEQGLGAYLVLEANASTGLQLANLLYEAVEAAVLVAR